MIPVWDENNINSVKPAQNLFDNGYSSGDSPISSNINWLFNGITTNSLPVGLIVPYLGAVNGAFSVTIPGWLKCLGDTIGSVNSNATITGDNLYNLFIHLWESRILTTISGGRGASAQADWTANKTLELPNLAEKSLAQINSQSGSVLNASLGGTVGSNTETLTIDQIPPHAHTFSFIPTQITRGDLVDPSNNDGVEIYALNSGGYSGSTGGSGSHSNQQPSFYAGYIIKL